MEFEFEFFRTRAKHMRDLAKSAPRELRAELLAVAFEYDRLADEAEKRNAK